MEDESFSSRLLQRVVDKKHSLYLFLSNVFQNQFTVFPRRQDVSLLY